MNRPEVYHKSVQILFDAYFNDTLKHEDCYACAVGNLVAANMKYKRNHEGKWVGKKRVIDYPGKNGWARVFCTSMGFQFNRPELYFGTAKEQIDSTGYTWQELAKIEKAFELTEVTLEDEEWMFNGLVAVLEVLKEIHEVTDEELIESNHKRFKDHHERKVLLTP